MRCRSIVSPFLTLGALLAPSGALPQTCVANVPHVDGQWGTLPYLMPINPISATLLHDGRILLVAGSENDASNNTVGAESYRNAVWDPTGTTQASIEVQNIEYDVFCSGTAVLPDGRPLVVGGTSDYSFTGEARSSIFDPVTSSFLQTPSMVDGRWYATATALGDGRVMAFSGTRLNGATNNTVEIYDLRTAGNGWTSPATAPFTPPLYPRMALLPNGKVFFTGQGSGGGTTATSWIFDPGPRTWTASAATTGNRTYGSAVILPLLPPGYTPRVMNFGGGSPATATTEIVDLSAATPTWQPAASMSSGRIQMNATLLPNGKVLAEGGSQNNESPSTPGKRADLYDPVANTFTSAGTASYSRLYHSVAILLPDATVVSMGSNPGSRGSYEPTIEIYTPSYLFDANDQLITTGRPGITGITPAAGPLGYNAPFSVTYTSTSAISSAVLVRPGSATHASDMDQRLIGLCGAAPQPPCTGSGTLALRTPPNGNIAPPGWYMLFLLDAVGVPSQARFLHISPYTTTPPVGTIDSPAGDITTPAGGSVFFATSAAAAHYSWIFPGGSPPTSTAQTPGNVTFTTPGEYTTSLTVIDAAGNSDPSPPTRTITVLPSIPDFDISVTPSSEAVIPGGSTTFTVVVTPKSGFTGTVSLGVGSESGFPTGITSGGFSPASIVGGGGSSTLTMRTTTSATPYALSLTVTGTSGTIGHTASTTLLVDLAAPASLTATAGNTQVALSWPATVGATSYHVKRALVTGGPYTTVACTTSTSYTDTGLTNGTTYYYVVSAGFTAGTNAGGESPDSAEASAAPRAATTTTSTSSTTTSRPTITATSTSVTSTSSTSSTTITPNYDNDASVRVCYNFESGAITTDAKTLGGRCGAVADTLSSTGLTGSATAQEAAQSANFTGALLQESCPPATCTDWDLSATNRFTVMAWIRPSSSSASYGFVIDRIGLNVSTFEMYLMASDGGKLHLDVRDANCSSVTSVVSAAAIPLNVWTHVAATYDGANITLYLNGTASTPVARTGALCNTGITVNELGNNEGGASRQFNGLVDEVRIFSRAFSATETCNVCLNGSSGTHSPAHAECTCAPSPTTTTTTSTTSSTSPSSTSTTSTSSTSSSTSSSSSSSSTSSSRTSTTSTSRTTTSSTLVCGGTRPRCNGFCPGGMTCVKKGPVCVCR